MVWMGIIFLGIAAVLFVIGGFMRRGKGLMLLAGYNTLPSEEREKTDKTELGRQAGNMLIRTGFWGVGICIASWLQLNWLVYILFGLFCVDPILCSFRMSRVLPTSLSSKKASMVIIILCIIILAVMGGMWVYGEMDPVVTVEDETIVIDSMYGIKIPLADVVDISNYPIAMEQTFADMVRTNGYRGFSDVIKGNFRDPAYGDILLYVHEKTEPTIRISCNGKKTVFINLERSDETYLLFSRLYASWEPYREKLYAEWYTGREQGVVPITDGGGEQAKTAPPPFEIPVTQDAG